MTIAVDRDVEDRKGSVAGSVCSAVGSDGQPIRRLSLVSIALSSAATSMNNPAGLSVKLSVNHSAASLMKDPGDDDCGADKIRPWWMIIEKNPVVWLKEMNGIFGVKLMVLLFCVQHLCKGFMMQLVYSPQQYVYKAYHVPAPQVQIYNGATMLPWAMKPIMGLLSDAVPIFGYRKFPYMVFCSAVGLVSVIVVCVTNTETISVEAVVACFFCMQYFLSTTDLLSEAKYSEELKRKPENGPDLMSFVWGGMAFWSLLATAMAPALIKYGLRTSYWVCLFPMIVTFYPIAANFLKEKKMSPKMVKKTNLRLVRQPEAFMLCIVMFLGVVTLSGFGLFLSNIYLNAIASACLGFIMLVSFSLVLPPTVAKVNGFFLIQSSMKLSISGAAFYFYTDTAEQYPEGPHFSQDFYLGVLGVSSSVCSVIGIITYQRWFRHYKYISLLLGVNFFFATLNVFDIVVFLRVNDVVGISDEVFVLGGTCFENLIHQWMWMPGIVILAQMVQPGMEATMYALLAGCHNLGNTVSSNMGAVMLDLFGVVPKGVPNESHTFKYLWVCSLCSTLLPLITCVLMPYMLPHSRQDEKIEFQLELTPYQKYMGMTIEDVKARIERFAQEDKDTEEEEKRNSALVTELPEEEKAKVERVDPPVRPEPVV